MAVKPILELNAVYYNWTAENIRRCRDIKTMLVFALQLLATSLKNVFKVFAVLLVFLLFLLILTSNHSPYKVFAQVAPLSSVVDNHKTQGEKNDKRNRKKKTENESAGDGESAPIIKRCGVFEAESEILEIYASDKVADIYYFDKNGTVVSQNTKTGQINWSAESGGRIVSKIVADDNFLYFAVATSRAGDGQQKNNGAVNADAHSFRDTEKKIGVTEKLSGDLPAGSLSDAVIVRALNKKTGVPVWQLNADSSNADLAGETTAKSALFGEGFRLYLVLTEKELYLTASDGRAALIKKDTGALIWAKDLGIDFSGAPYFPASVDQNIFSASANFFDSANPPNFPNVFPSEMLFANKKDSLIYSFSINERKIINKNVHVPRLTALIKSAGKVITGDQHGMIRAFDLTRTGASAAWNVTTGAAVSHFVETADGILATSFDNFAYLISTNGKIIWKKRFSARLRDEPFVAKGKSIAVLTIGDFAYFIDLKRKGSIINQFQIAENEVFTAVPSISDDAYIFAVGKNMLLYRLGKC